MSKLTKIICIFVLLFSLCFNITYATNTDELDTNTTTIDSEEPVEESDENTTYTGDTDATFSNAGVTSVSQLSNYSEANLELNNILNIILIAIGVLIILFAIAILIRLKQ